MRRKLPPDTSVDDLEHAFYEALQAGDLNRLMACWADEEEVVCVHPGGARLLGLTAIRQAFGELFQRGALAVHPHHVRRLVSGTQAVHNVVERIDVPTSDGLRHAYVIATNVYTQTPRGWRMVLHHASPGVQQDPAEPAAAAHTLH